eukprot:scaffold20941_cov34-Tisochrysis_lutea.AAC.1
MEPKLPNAHILGWSRIEGDDNEGELDALTWRQMRAPFTPEMELRTPSVSLKTLQDERSDSLSSLGPSMAIEDAYAQVPDTVGFESNRVQWARTWLYGVHGEVVRVGLHATCTSAPYDHAA